MDNTKGSSLWVVVVLVIALALALIWAFVSGWFILPTQNKYDNLEEELYKSIPAEVGYGVQIKKDDELGDYLATPSGKTLYITTNEKCDAICLEAWTPYIVATKSDDEANAILSTIEVGGVMQQTYNGTPLYSYKGDVNIGDINGHSIGGVWFLARP
ncbi:MAG: hypothetical protein AAB840_00710 [Patescibacteria group bacterium]